MLGETEMAADAHAAPEIIQNIYIPGKRKGTHRVAVMIPSFTGGWGALVPVASTGVQGMWQHATGL